jgi:hypothetical protein
MNRFRPSTRGTFYCLLAPVAYTAYNLCLRGVAKTLRTLLGIGAGVLAGVAFAALVVGVRRAVTSATSAEAVVFLISVMGVGFIGNILISLGGQPKGDAADATA